MAWRAAHATLGCQPMMGPATRLQRRTCTRCSLTCAVGLMWDLWPPNKPLACLQRLVRSAVATHEDQRVAGAQVQVHHDPRRVLRLLRDVQLVLLACRFEGAPHLALIKPPRAVWTRDMALPHTRRQHHGVAVLVDLW